MSIASVMDQALRAGGTVQAEVRKLLELPEDQALEILCEEIGVFKRGAEIWIDNEVDENDRAAARRRVNNIIGDCSRLTRERLGKSIVCVSRKNHTYEAVDPVARATSKPVTSPYREDPEHARLKAEVQELETIIEGLRAALTSKSDEIERWEAMVDDAPGEMIDILINTHGWEQVGRITVAQIKEAQA